MENQMGFEFLEHTADVYIAAHGKHLSEAFENSARALFDVMTDVDRISPSIQDCVEVSGIDEEALLYSWLEALLVKHELEGMLYSKFKILKLDKVGDEFQLQAQIWGEKFDARRHRQKVGVKAVTYHRMEIVREPEKVTVKFILDI